MSDASGHRCDDDGQNEWSSASLQDGVAIIISGSLRSCKSDSLEGRQIGRCGKEQPGEFLATSKGNRACYAQRFVQQQAT